jgi:hypothetical protein
LRSRKFWAALLSLVGTGVAYSYGKIDAQTAIMAGIGALAAYSWAPAWKAQPC